MLSQAELSTLIMTCGMSGLTDPRAIACAAIDKDYARGNLPHGEIELAFIDYLGKINNILNSTSI